MLAKRTLALLAGSSGFALLCGAIAYRIESEVSSTNTAQLAQNLSVPLVLVGNATSERDIDSSSAKQSQTDAIVRSAMMDHVQTMIQNFSPEAKAGYRVLVENAYLPHDFNEDVVQQLESLAIESPFVSEESDESASTDTAKGWTKERRNALKKFGITARPDEADKPLQYVVTEDGNWVMNCFACHGGSTYGVSFPGAPNTTYALESLTEQVRRIKLKKKIPLAHMDVGSIAMPLGTTVGTSNAVMFGVALMNYRDRELNVLPLRAPAPMVHHDMDAPAWWHFQRKTHIYADGFAEKGHKGLMQFMLVRQNGPEKFREWQKDFKKVYAFLSEIKPPKYPLPIQQERAEKGRLVFEQHCASCHGTYGEQSHYPEVNIALSDIGTDPVRYQALTPQNRKNYGDSWFADYGQQSTIEVPEGYTAPPLDGIWATAPYFHNGSVPSLKDVLFPEGRPSFWRRTSESFDESKVGFHYTSMEKRPADFKSLSNYEKRLFFDTTAIGKSNKGHDYPSQIPPEERVDLLEYLKTL